MAKTPFIVMAAWSQKSYQPVWAAVGAASLVVSLAAWHLVGGAKYVFAGFATYVIVGSLHERRWRDEGRNPVAALMAGVMWPAFVLALPYLIWREERDRKLRIVREVMES